MLAAGETVVPVRVGREGLGTLTHIQAVLCGGSTEHREKQSSILTSILSFVLYFSMRKNNNKLKCAFRPFKGQLSGNGWGARWEGRLGKERCRGKTRKRHSWLFSFLVCRDPGNEKRFDPGLVPSLELRSITFSQSSPG